MRALAHWPTLPSPLPVTLALQSRAWLQQQRCCKLPVLARAVLLVVVRGPCSHCQLLLLLRVVVLLLAPPSLQPAP